MQKGLKVSFPPIGSLKDKAKSNIGFLNVIVLPLYQNLSELQPKFE